MAGHSQFKNIMHRKSAQDKKRAQLFNKLAREIQVAAKLGSPDPASNPRLRTAIANARAASMPKDRIERAIASSQRADAENYEEVRYEGFGPGGTALIVEALTDNRNRTAAEVRAIFSKNGGNMGETGCASFLFERVGLIVYPAAVADADTVFEAAAEAGADNVESDRHAHEITCAPDMLAQVARALEERLGEPQSAKLAWKAKEEVPVSLEDAEKLMKLISALEDNDDVQEVYGNYAISDEVMEKLEAA